MKTKVAVVIPNWNGADYLSACLDSLKKQSVIPHIIVVENGSTDNSIELINNKHPDVDLLKYADNAGFAGGVNRGIRHAMKQGFEFIALFNNDAVADKNWVEELLKAIESDSVTGIVTSKFMRMDKKHIDSTGDFYSTIGIPFPRGRNQPDKGQYDKPGLVFAATGGASLYRAALFEAIGLFDEDFFAYYEDVDISFRAQLAGWKVCYQPTAIAFHHVSGTSSKLGGFSRYHSVKNFILLYNKNMPGFLFWKYKPLFFYGMLRMFGASLRDKQPAMFAKGFLKAAVLVPSTLKKRRAIHVMRKVDPVYIEAQLYKGTPPKIPKL